MGIADVAVMAPPGLQAFFEVPPGPSSDHDASHRKCPAFQGPLTLRPPVGVGLLLRA